jgi:phosphate transport system permease protein
MASPTSSLELDLRRPTGRDRRRAFLDRFSVGLSALVTVLAILPLGAIIFFVTVNGVGGLTAEFFTQPPGGTGRGGALAAVLGTLQLVPAATLLAAPLGVLGGVFVAEHASPRAAASIRFATDVLLSVPSIVIGVFVYALLVLPVHHFNAFAGVVALAVVMLPVIVRSTDEMLRLVPGSVREASLALGLKSWRTIVSVVLRTARAGVLAGIMLAVARAAGETAPLVTTALGSRLVNFGNPGEPIDALPLFIYNNSGQPDPYLIRQAWGAALLLLVLVLATNILVRGRSVGERSQ